MLLMVNIYYSLVQREEIPYIEIILKSEEDDIVHKMAFLTTHLSLGHYELC
jgi:hypothetical protein